MGGYGENLLNGEYSTSKTQYAISWRRKNIAASQWVEIQ